MKKLIIPIVELLANWHILTPIRVAKLRYMYIMHKWPHFEHPKDLNEKINYLKFYGDTSKWPMLTDKYAVRKYIESVGLGDTLVKLYGKWDSVEDIDWDSLPDKFVMKCNNGSGDVLICKDKAKLDIEATKRYFDKMLHREFGVVSAEPHYASIKPCIIAEELLDASTQPCGSSSLVDYKIWCFNGKAHNICCYYDRKGFDANKSVYDLKWQYRQEYMASTKHYKDSGKRIPKPACLDEMINIAERLSTGFPVVRVDLYEVDGKIYFGELTFTAHSGCLNTFSQRFLDETGALIKLN